MSSTQTKHASKPDSQPSSTLPSKESVIAAARQCCQQSVDEKPVSTAMVAAGVGAAVGLLATALLIRDQRQIQSSWLDRVTQEVSNRMGQVDPGSFFKHR